MKMRFTSLDLSAQLTHLRETVVGMRVNQVYDIDHKSYILKLQQPEKKVMLLFESGSRIHTTEFEWPKNPAPSGFSMKLRKHVNNKRLEAIEQLGVDRVVDLRFGSDEAAYHVILELYDRGNVVLTDFEYKILNILRPRVQGEEKFLVRETYPVELARQDYEAMNEERLRGIFEAAKPGDSLKKMLAPHFEYGPALLEHLMLGSEMAGNLKRKDIDLNGKLNSLLDVFTGAEAFLKDNEAKGYIVQKSDMRPRADGAEEEFLSFIEFHPYPLRQHESMPRLEFVTFDRAIDEFFSKLEAQKIEVKSVQQERMAMKKLQNVRKDHDQRLEALKTEQERDQRKATLVEMNEELVENALAVMRSAIANQIDWKEIQELIKEAKERRDPVASRITGLKLDMNHFTMMLSDPYAYLDEDDDDEDDEEARNKPPSEMEVDIDLDLSAQANARKVYDAKKFAANKERKTLESHSVAMKSAEKKTKQSLKEMNAIHNIIKARKVFWFEKFFWFISSENYLVIGGRDMQQNELIFKKYMRAGDLYVHADLHGASSVVIKNPSGAEVPPKTLNEAGHMAVCFSLAWDAKVLAAAWWVQSSQVSKTAPSGEYLSTGSFMIRGKKNFLLPSHLVLGFGFLFKLEDDSIARHKDERKVRTIGDDDATASMATMTDIESVAESPAEVEIEVGDSQDEEELKDEVNAENVKEESGDDDKSAADEKEDKSDSEEEGESAFPDTNIDIKYSESGEVKVKARGLSESGEARSASTVGEEKQEELITFAAHTRRKQQQTQKMKPVKKSKGEQQQEEQARAAANTEGQNQNKRGRKGKMKKMKDKYKDQDEEDKELRMQFLQGSQKENKASEKKKNREAAAAKEEQKPLSKPLQKPKQQPRPKTEQEGGGENVELDDDEEEKVPTVNAEVDMLDSLTGVPHPEDELLFAVPVVAPYNTMVNYKYKVKVTPGTGKKGKATKTALSMFIADRSTSQREKELLKSVKDVDLARGLPSGKVKLTAPNLQKAKKKTKK